MATSQQKQQKKLPKRTSSASRKAYRAKAWIKQRKRIRQRAEAQRVREQANRVRREAGEMTPWEISKALRNAKRHG